MIKKVHKIFHEEIIEYQIMDLAEKSDTPAKSIDKLAWIDWHIVKVGVVILGSLGILVVIFEALKIVIEKWNLLW